MRLKRSQGQLSKVLTLLGALMMLTRVADAEESSILEFAKLN